MEEPSWNFGKNWKPNCTPLYSRLKDNANSMLNQMIIGWIYIKIKFEDLIRLLIGQFDLIISPIKGLIKF
jgi:hypothetical protein